GVATNTLTDTNYFGLSGQGVVVAVDDTGIDVDHPDLQGRVRVDPLGPPVIAQDTDGHGTHVAGIIAGSGAKSVTVSNAVGSINPGTNTQYRGKAPKANLYSVEFLRPDAYLQEIAARTNALISNNSWVYGGSFDYDLAAASYDAAVRDAVPESTGSQPVIFVFPTGNGGGINNIDPGVNDDGTGGNADTVQSPGTAKNVITVGAVEQFRNITNSAFVCSGGFCITNQPWLATSDSSNQVAGFSGRGNVGLGVEGDFGRFKPDVVAPGSFVVSTRSTHWDETNYYDATSVTTEVLNSLVVISNSSYSSGIFVPDHASQLTVSVENVVPNVNLTVLLYPPGSTTPISGVNQVSVAPVPTGDFWTYTVTNTTSQTAVLDLRTVLVTLNNNGNYFDELRTNLNAGVGPFYRYESGTSMAAADVSGTLALMEEFFTQRFHVTNSPALMKALLINGARPVGDLYDLQVKNNINFQGWGQIYLPTTLHGSLSNSVPSSTAASSMYVFDQNPTNALSTGRSHTRKFSVSPAAQGEPLRVTLVWTDPPGDPAASIKLVNDLDLVVTNLDTGDVFFGNDITAGHDFNAPWNTNQPAAI
ncbi:MAG TPA: S8 family serine peptidase, partial [Verrucomicrobiae bacterium]|nr:S8 family serine peptidase [Verrucomicrobiae bacterium]